MNADEKSAFTLLDLCKPSVSAIGNGFTYQRPIGHNGAYQMDHKFFAEFPKRHLDIRQGKYREAEGEFQITGLPTYDNKPSVWLEVHCYIPGIHHVRICWRGLPFFPIKDGRAVLNTDAEASTLLMEMDRRRGMDDAQVKWIEAMERNFQSELDAATNAEPTQPAYNWNN